MLRQLLILSFIVIGGCVNAQSKIDVLHYRYEIELNDRNDTIRGKAIITFVALSELKKMRLDLGGGIQSGPTSPHIALKPKEMELIGMDIRPFIAHDMTVIPPPMHIDDKIFFELLQPRVKKGDTLEATIYYKGIPNDGLIISKNKYGDRTFFADNWPNRAHHWIPCVDDPADKASLEFIVIAPSHYSVISNGIKIEEKEIGNGKKLTHWKEDTPLPTKIMVIGVARFAIKQFEDSPANIPVTAWVYPRDSTEGFKNYSLVPAILKFFTGYIGPFPYEKLANVQSKTMFGGMENASAIFYYEESATSKSLENTLAHEVAHQYFGDMATEKSFPHLWLSEGFATQLTHIYIESKYGTDSLNNEMKKDRMEIIAFAKESDRPVVDSVSPLMQLLNANSYQKGGWVLHMLRRQLGDSVFHKIIRSYYSAYAGKNADTRDFQKICEQESGKDLNVFFNQWLYAPGLPKLELKWEYDPKNKTVLLTVKQLQKNLFQFPLEIQIQSVSGKSKWETLSITRQIQQFSMPVKEIPAKLYLDPNTSLLFEGSVSMTK